MNKFLLSNLTEYQKSLLTRLAYLNIDFNQFQKLKESQTIITISDLKKSILKPNEPYLGSLHLPQLKRVITSVSTTNLEFINELECAGLGDLEVIDLADNKRTGFNGICFKDSKQNVGFSFRGTDLKSFSSLAADGLADLEAFLTNNTEQINQAQTLFEQHQNPLGQNFLYGHSLGGFLAESIYLRNYENISNAFVVNPLHINSQLLDEQSKIDAFNNPAKFSCFVTGGDYVSSINTPDLFSNNVLYVKNNKESFNNPIVNHLVEAGKFDENGNFVECTKEDAFAGHTLQSATAVINFINNERIKGFFSRAFLATKKWFSSVRLNLINFFKKREHPNEENNQIGKEDKVSDFKEYLDPKNYIVSEYPEKNHKNSQNRIKMQESLSQPPSGTGEEYEK